MAAEPRIVEERTHGAASRAAVRGLTAYSRSKAGKSGWKPFALTLRDDNDVIVGGIVAHMLWNWCFINLFWIDEPYRGRRHGATLLARVEAIAKKRGAQHIYLDTFSFQGDGFYQKHGYEVFGRLDDFPPGHHRIWLKKDLTPPRRPGSIAQGEA